MGKEGLSWVPKQELVRVGLGGRKRRAAQSSCQGEKVLEYPAAMCMSRDLATWWKRRQRGERVEKQRQERCQTNVPSIRVRLGIFCTPVFRIILDKESPGHGDQLDSRTRKNSKLRL